MGHRHKLSEASAILIAGPTASGKSALALTVAKLVHGAVVNADSMQVYQDLRILSARPAETEMEGVPHRLYGHVDGAVNYSVGHYLADLGEALERLRHEGLKPVIVGGTGLYFKAMTEGLSPMPQVPEASRARVRAMVAGMTAHEMHHLLAGRDAAMARRLRPSDPQRVMRALEVLDATGRSLAHWQDLPRAAPLVELSSAQAFFLDVPRAWVCSRIDRRFEAMMAEGALKEAGTLHQRALDPALPVMRAHGVPGLIASLEGRTPLETAIEKGKSDTRAYAKRQVTWFRHQCPGFAAVAPETLL